MNATTIAQTEVQSDPQPGKTSRYTILDREKPALRHLVARYAVAYTEIAYGFEFTVIAACVIGGVSIAGGVGSVLGAMLGALFLSVIGNALPVLQVSPFWQSALTGLVILVAVLVNARGAKHRSRQILPLHTAVNTTMKSAA